MTLWDQIKSYVDRRLETAKRFAARCTLWAVDNALSVQAVTELRGLSDERHSSKTELFQQYGFRSNPLPGTEGVVVFVGGASGHPIVVATEKRGTCPVTLESGEVGVYSDEGDYVVFRRGNRLEIYTKDRLQIDAEGATEHNTPAYTLNCETAEFTAANSVTVNAPQVTVNAGSFVNLASPIIAMGLGTKQPLVLGEAMASLFNGHTHGGGPTPDQTMGGPQLSSYGSVS